MSTVKQKFTNFRQRLKDRVLNYLSYDKPTETTTSNFQPMGISIATNIRELLSAYRFGQKVDQPDMDDEIARNNTANWLAVQVPEHTFTAEPEIRDFSENQEEGELVEDVTKAIRTAGLREIFIHTAKHENRAGAASLARFEDGWEVFPREKTWVRYDSSGRIVQFKLEKQLPSGCGYANPEYIVPGEIQVHPETEEDVWVGGGAFEDVILAITRPHLDYPEMGVPLLTPLWDIIKSISIISECVTLRSTKAGSLIKKGTVAVPNTGPTFNIKDRETAMQAALKTLDRDTIATMRRYLTPEGNILEDSIDLMDADMLGRYLEVLEFFIWQLASHTGIPANWFKGLISGELTGSTEVVRQIQAYYRNIQKSWQKVHNAVCKYEAEMQGLNWGDDYRIVWPLRQKLTEDQEATIMGQKTQAAITAYSSGLWTLEEAREYTDKDPAITPVRPADMMIEIGNEQNDKSNEENRTGSKRPSEGTRGDNKPAPSGKDPPK